MVGGRKLRRAKGVGVFNCVPHAGFGPRSPHRYAPGGCEHTNETPLVLVGMAQADPAETVSRFRQIGTLFRESILIIRVLLT
jgi:hypothetical protein